jgi:hypothetical protein
VDAGFFLPALRRELANKDIKCGSADPRVFIVGGVTSTADAQTEGASLFNLIKTLYVYISAGPVFPVLYKKRHAEKQFRELLQLSV